MVYFFHGVILLKIVATWPSFNLSGTTCMPEAIVLLTRSVNKGTRDCCPSTRILLEILSKPEAFFTLNLFIIFETVFNL